MTGLPKSTGPCVGLIGIDHRHSYGMLSGIMAAGATCKGWYTAGTPGTLPGFLKRFPDIRRTETAQQLIDDPEIDLILIADIPNRRADIAIAAMEAGKDVMVDKPGCTTPAQLARLRDVQARTGRIWSINFSERFEVPSTAIATRLIQEGEIGKVVQTIGLGPHRLNRETRPDWFFDSTQYGGILIDIASHQIDQFLWFTGSDSAEIVASSVGNFANPDDPGLEDFGEILIRSDHAQGYIRVDWYTPDALPNWGDGRLTILGTEGYIELRKYVDPVGRDGTDHVFFVNGTRYEYQDGSTEPLTYFDRLVADIRDRTSTAMDQAHCFRVMELALQAQAMAERRGALT